MRWNVRCDCQMQYGCHSVLVTFTLLVLCLRPSNAQQVKCLRSSRAACTRAVGIITRAAGIYTDDSSCCMEMEVGVQCTKSSSGPCRNAGGWHDGYSSCCLAPGPEEKISCVSGTASLCEAAGGRSLERGSYTPSCCFFKKKPDLNLRCVRSSVTACTDIPGALWLGYVCCIGYNDQEAVWCENDYWQGSSLVWRTDPVICKESGGLVTGGEKSSFEGGCCLKYPSTKDTMLVSSDDSEPPCPDVAVHVAHKKCLYIYPKSPGVVCGAVPTGDDIKYKSERGRCEARGGVFNMDSRKCCQTRNPVVVENPYAGMMCFPATKDVCTSRQGAKFKSPSSCCVPEGNLRCAPGTSDACAQAQGWYTGKFFCCFSPSVGKNMKCVKGTSSACTQEVGRYTGEQCCLSFSTTNEQPDMQCPGGNAEACGKSGGLFTGYYCCLPPSLFAGKRLFCIKKPTKCQVPELGGVINTGVNPDKLYTGTCCIEFPRPTGSPTSDTPTSAPTTVRPTGSPTSVPPTTSTPTTDPNARVERSTVSPSARSLTPYVPRPAPGDGPKTQRESGTSSSEAVVSAAPSVRAPVWASLLVMAQSAFGMSLYFSDCFSREYF